MSGLEFALLLALGLVAGLDTVSVPQAMVSRPIVAASLAGLVTGALEPALVAGAVLELFALETLPVGAARYPDWGPASVAAGASAGWVDSGAAGTLTAVIVGLAFAWLGGWTMHVARRRNAITLARYRDALDRGERAAIHAVQRAGLAHDALRALALSGVALVGGRLMAGLSDHWEGPALLSRTALAATAAGVALWAGWRLFSSGRSGVLFAAGLGIGAAAAAAWWGR